MEDTLIQYCTVIMEFITVSSFTISQTLDFADLWTLFRHTTGIITAYWQKWLWSIQYTSGARR